MHILKKIIRNVVKFQLKMQTVIYVIIFSASSTNYYTLLFEKLLLYNSKYRVCGYGKDNSRMRYLNFSVYGCFVVANFRSVNSTLK